MVDFTICRKNGGQIIWEQSQIDYIISEYLKGRTPPSIGNDFNLKAEPIRGLLKRNGIKILSVKERAFKEYPRNSNYFSRISNSEKAYWLGFLYADGCVSDQNQISISIQESDKEHLEKFKEDIGAINNRILSVKSHNKFGWYFTIRDSKMASDLKKLGCIPRKSLVLIFPKEEQVPKEYLFDFIRGYFDGDGTISFDHRNEKPQIRFGFCGTKEFLTSLLEILNWNVCLRKISENNTYTISRSGNKVGKTFFEKIYNNPTRYLTRKYNLYQFFLNYSA